MDLAHPKQSPPDTQGSGLPRNKGSIKQPTIPVLGEEVENLNNWLAEVSFALKPLGIKRVLDSHLRRPTRSDPNYEIWQYCSTRVAGWLFSHVSEEIRNKLCSNKRRVPQSFLNDNSGMQYADEVMRAIIDLMQPGTKNHYVMSEVQKHQQINRARYRSAKEYIIAYREQTTLLHSKHAAPAPLYALTTIIRQLKGELALIDDIELEVAAHRSEEVTWKIFHNICKHIESECNKIQSGSGSGSTVRPGNHNSNDVRDKSTSKTHGSR